LKKSTVLHCDVAGSMFRKPILPPLVIRHHPLQPSPELGCVVRLKQMNELMDNKVLHDTRGQKDRRPVEV